MDHTPDTALEIDTFLCSLKYKYKIDDELYDFLSPVSPLRTPIFYLLPKVHKPKIPGRPIISGCDSPTSCLSISWTITSNLVCPPSPPSSKTQNISCKRPLMTSLLSQRVPPWSHLTLKPYTPISHMMRVYGTV